MINRELNLLPPTRRNLLARLLIVNSLNSFLKSVIWSLLLVTVVGVATAGALRIWVAALPAATSELLSQEVAVYKELRNEISIRNDNLKLMKSLSEDRIVWSALFPSVFESLTPGTQVQVLSGDGGTNSRFSVSGQAVARNALVVMQDRLSKLDWVAAVKAPNSNLLERTNPTFTFDISLKKNGEPAPKEGEATQ